MIPIFQISFATEDESLGVVFTQAANVVEALNKLIRLGIHPGGEALAIEIAQESLSEVPLDQLDVLLSRVALEELTGPAVRLKDDVKLYDFISEEAQRLTSRKERTGYENHNKEPSLP